MAEPVEHYGKWRIRWQDADGKRRSKTFTSKSAAKRALRKYEAEADAIRAGLMDPKAEENAAKTFSDLADYWLINVTAHKRSPKDDKSILRVHLRAALDEKKLSAITQEVVDDLRTSISNKGLKANTVAHIMSLLRAMLNKAEQMGWVRSAPKVEVPRPGTADYNWLDSVDKIHAFIRAAFAEEEAGRKRGQNHPGLGTMSVYYKHPTPPTVHSG